MSYAAIDQAFELESVKGVRKFILICLARRERNGICFPSLSKMVSDSGLDKKTVKAALAWLKDNNVIQDTGQRKGRTKQIIVYCFPFLSSKEGQISTPLKEEEAHISPPSEEIEEEEAQKAPPLLEERGPYFPTKGAVFPQEGGHIWATEYIRESINESNSLNSATGEYFELEESAPGGRAIEPPAINDFYLTKKKRQLKGNALASFNEFMGAFDYRKGKALAADAWLEIGWSDSPESNEALFQQILTAARFEAQQRPFKVQRGITAIYPEGWLSQRRWEDESADLAANDQAGKAEGKKPFLKVGEMLNDLAW